MQVFSGKDYLKIDIANSFGLDKLVWSERIHWFDQHEAILESLTRQAKEPAQFMAGTMAWRATQRKEPTGYLCGLDATASGLQLLSVLSGCQQSAATCNLIDTGKREDAYTLVHEKLCELLGITPVQFPISRKDSKQALMTHLYGSKAVPKRVFGENTPELKAFYAAIDELLPGANQLNHDLLALWNPEAYAHSWTLPDSFDVVIKVMDTDEHQVEFLGKEFTVREQVNRPMESGLSLGANIVHSIDGMVVREMGRRCNHNTEACDRISNLLLTGTVGLGCSTQRKQDLALMRVLALYDMSQFMPAVVLEHLDKHNAGHLSAQHKSAILDLLDSLPALPFPLICIHDCFKFHANHGNDVRQQYINILAELADSNIMSSIASEVAGRHVPVNKLSNNLAVHIRNAEYAIC